MAGGESFSFKSSFMLVAAVVTFGAMLAGDPGGRFDRLSLTSTGTSTGVVKTRKPIGGSTGGSTTGTTTGTGTGTTTGTTTTNALYPELTAIPSNFDTASELVPSWGTGKIADSFGEAVGAFRFFCNFGQILRDDPIMYPGQPGKSHLHAFFGNTGANAYSTYSSLRTTGNSTCMSPLNRSAYWAPAMLDGVGHVVVPDNGGIYYKRYPASAPQCNPADSRYEGTCVGLPNGLRMIFGYDMMTGRAPEGSMWWNCGGQTSTNVPGQSDHYPTIAAAAAHCPTGMNPDGSYNYILAVIAAPNCWDGKNLDSANHRDHMAYEQNTGLGYFKCPADHPFIVPSFVLSIAYTVDANLGTWHLSSDEMHPELPAGSTLHSDWFGAWDNGTEAMWIDNCINKKLNCSGGDLGNGKQLRMYDGFSWTAKNHIVPIPS